MTPKTTTKTATREKYSLYLEQADLDRLREYEREVGVPVSESVRRAVAAYVASLPTPKAIAKLFK
jgi:hypothetical protein